MSQEENPFEGHRFSHVSPYIIGFEDSSDEAKAKPKAERKRPSRPAFTILRLLAGIPNVVYACIPRLANIPRFRISAEKAEYTLCMMGWRLR